MKRDMDLVRLLLIKIADDSKFNGRSTYVVHAHELAVEGFEDMEVDYHLGQLIDAGLLEGKPLVSPGYTIKKVTWQGHEFLDDTRDPDIWEKAKGKAQKVAGVGFGLMLEIAKAEIKAKLHLP